LKQTFGVAAGALEMTEEPHGSEGRFLIESVSPHLASRRMIVLRDPFKRAVSVYLDKIACPQTVFGVEVCRVILRTQRNWSDVDIEEGILAGATPTFGEFVAYLSFNPDRLLNEHFRSQCSFWAFKNYHDVLALERLEADWPSLRLDGIPLLSHWQTSSTHGRTVVDDPQECGSFGALSSLNGGDLQYLVNATGSVPSASHFYDNDDILDKFIRRYIDDIVVFSEFFPELAKGSLFGTAFEGFSIKP
jgi:hypothetical protein